MLLLASEIAFLGTIKKNKPDILREFLLNSTRSVASSIYAYQECSTLAFFITKKNIREILLSNMHDDDEICPGFGKLGRPNIC